jgi:hypothetical protein
VAGAQTDRRSSVVTHLLTGGRCSPEGERVVVEQSRCDALSREPEPVNPRVSPSWTSTREDPVTAGLGKPRGAASFARVWNQGFFSFSYSIRFFSTLI